MGKRGVSWTFRRLEFCIEGIPRFRNGLQDSSAPNIRRLQSGASFPKDTTSLLNYILTPIVVAIHLSQFADYHQLGPAREDRYNQVLEESRETLGFCSGLLSAVAVACAGTFEELQQHGATALRLAMLIGLAVDVDNAAVEDNADGWGSVSVGWTSAESEAQLAKVLKQVPEVRIDPFGSGNIDGRAVSVRLTRLLGICVCGI